MEKRGAGGGQRGDSRGVFNLQEGRITWATHIASSRSLPLNAAEQIQRTLGDRAMSATEPLPPRENEQQHAAAPPHAAEVRQTLVDR